MKKSIAIIILIFLLIQLVFTTYSNFQEFIDLQIIISNSFVSDKSITFMLKTNDTNSYPKVKDIISIISKHKNMFLYSQFYDKENNCIIGTYANSKNYILDNLNMNNLKNNMYSAIVGRNIKYYEMYHKSNGKQYISIFNKEYLVIDEIDYKINNMLDNNIYINLSSIKDKVLKIYTIDGIEENQIKKVFKQIEKEYNVYEVNKNDNFVQKYIFSSTDISLLRVLILVILLSLMIIQFVNIVKFYESEIKIKIIIGVNHNIIERDIMKHIFYIVIFSTIIFYLLYISIYYTILIKYSLSLNIIFMILFPITILLLSYIIIYMYIYVIKKLLYKRGGISI